MVRVGIRIIARIRPISLDDKDEKTASFKTSLLHLQCKTMLEDAFYTAKPQKVVFYTVKDVKWTSFDVKKTSFKPSVLHLYGIS